MSSKRLKTCSKIRPSRERGVALISVLWALLLLSGLAAAAAYSARSNAILTYNLGKLAQAESATEAALVNAIALLSDAKISRHPPIDGQPQTREFQGLPVAVAVSNEAGRIDVNSAEDALLLAFLQSQGVSEDRAAVLLDDLRRYQGVAEGPAPVGTLRTIDELKTIPSWATQDLDCWRNSLTVYTGLPGADRSDAPESVLAALNWQNGHRTDNADLIGSHRASTTSLDQSHLGEVVRIVASTAPSLGVAASAEWVGRLTGDARQPTLTMTWSLNSGERGTLCKKVP